MSNLDRERLLRRFAYMLPLVIGVVIAYVITTFSPLAIGALVILMVFLLLYVLFLSLSFAVIQLAEQIGKTLDRKWHLTNRRSYYLATVIAALPVLLLALNSIGQLSFIDVILAFCFVLVASFYVLRQTH